MGGRQPTNSSNRRHCCTKDAADVVLRFCNISAPPLQRKEQARAHTHALPFSFLSVLPTFEPLLHRHIFLTTCCVLPAAVVTLWGGANSIETCVLHVRGSPAPHLPSRDPYEKTSPATNRAPPLLAISPGLCCLLTCACLFVYGHGTAPHRKANARDSQYDATLLHWAVNEGHMPTVEHLLACGADVRLRDGKQ